MMTLAELLENLGKLGVKLWEDGGKLAYSAPRGVLTAALLQELRAHKEEVLASLRQTRSAASCPPLSRRPEEGSGPLPLSYGQQSLWFLEQLGSGSAYNLPAAFRVQGPLDTGALERSLSEIVRRHESLRTVFSTEEGRPRQVIQAPSVVPLPIQDLQPLPPEAQAEALRRAAAAEATHHFDLSRDLPVRALLSRLGPGEHVLFVTLHHIAADGWSIGIFFQELSSLYAAFSEGQPSPLSPLPVQYADFTLWQRSWLAGDRLARQAAFWKKHLEGAPALLALPTDRPRPPVQSYRGDSVAFRVEATLVDALRALSRRAGVTLFTTLLTAFDVLLARYSRQEDLVVGVPVAGRTAPGLEPLIGMFSNTLAVRADLSGDPTFLEMLSRVHAVLQEAYEHQDLPLQQVVAALQIERSLAHSPLYQATLVLQNTPPLGFTLAGAEVRVERFDVQTTRFDVVLDLTEQDGGLTGVCTYNADLFDASTTTRMLGHFQALLSGLAAAPEQRIEQIPMLTRAEQEALARWNDTAAPAPAGCVHELFAAQARRTPDALAAALLAPAGAQGARQDDAAASLTYRELDERSSQLAHHLRSLGVGRGNLVGVYMERSLELLVALLGVLKAGGAYLPLDPTYPRERIELIRRDAGAAVVLSQSHLISRLSPGAKRVVALDTEWPLLAGLSTAAPAGGAGPAELAYLMYTSGSTGRPKGVMIEHRGLTNYLSFAAREYGAGEGKGALLCSSIGFDLTVTSLFAPLLAGTAVFLLPPGDELPALAAELRRRRGLSFLKITPSHLAVLEQLVPAEQLAAAANVLILGGEQLRFEALSALRAQVVSPRIVNEYGPTETVVGCCVHEVGPGEEGGGAVPIGRAIDNTQLHVLDRHLAPVPVGVTGELYIGGAQVARGYLNRPELDAERFLVDPFAAPAGEGAAGAGPERVSKLYRTGDLARRRPDGTLEFLGRADRQVKLHGFRIELDEIETAIRELPGVTGAVVALRAEPRERLVAYFTRDAAVEVSDDALRTHLAERLPAYMVPAAFVALRELPLTAHGKVDVAALPAPDAAAAKEVPAAELPASPAEETLAAIFREVLGLSTVGVHDRFFRLGGDSISSVRLVAKARQAGLELSLQQVFQHQTVRALARCIGEGAGALAAARAETTAFGLVSAEDRARLPEGVEDAYPPAAVQLAMLFFSGLDADAPTYHSVSSHPLRVRFDAASWRQAAAAVLARHPVLRGAFDLSGFSEPLLLIHRHVEPPLHVHDLRSLPEDQRSRAFSQWLAAEQKSPFRWSEPPLFRIHLHRTGEETCRLTLTLHHALLDGWSLSVVVTELVQAYTALLSGERALLPPLSATYRDLVALERAARSDASAQRYWDDLLSDAPFVELPRWPASLRERDRGPGFVNVPLPAPLAAGLTLLANTAAVPIKSVLLAAHAFVLGRITGQVDMLLGLAAHGRPETDDAAEIAGNFLNVLPLRVDVSGGTWLDLCRAVVDAEQESLPYRHYPLAEMQRRAGRKRLFETAFNFIHFHLARRLTAVDALDVLEIEDVAPGEMTLQANFAVDPRAGGLNFQLTYDPSALCHAQVEAIAGYYLRALAAMCAEPAGRHERCSVLSPEERHKVLVAWNGPVTEVGARPFVHQAIAAQAASTPDAVAVASVDPAVPSLSYRELDERANRLARHLRALSIGPGSVIGMHVERSPEMIVGLLGALKSGAAYVPLDPTLPRERLMVLLEQTKPDVILHLGPPPELPGAPHRLSLDLEWRLIAEQPGTDPGVTISPSDLAYILFTSGSTGTPKGAQISQGNLAAFMDSARVAYGIEASDRVLQFCTLAFDTSIEEIYITLMQGGTLILRDDDLVSSPERFIAGCSRLGITAIHLPTAYWHMLTAELIQKGLSLPPPVRVVFIGGEAALPQRVNAWYRHFGDTPALVNTYGTTETTAVISIFTLGSWEERHREGLSFPVGRPLPTVQAYVVDRHKQPVPIGTPGALFIAGPQVGPGYWDLPERSVERYVPNPFGPGRMYESGDLVRWLPDGTLECCGRLDDQVKIRGYRVEPGEVESILSSHPEVRSAAVLVREERPGDRRLAAYAVVRAGAPALSTAQLRRYLQQKLPEYAVPPEIVLVDALPLTPNGKLDRRALLRLRAAPSEGAGDDASPEHAPPRTPTEARLAGIFAEVLGRPRIGIHDSFFELGGDSLVAMQISSRIHGAFEVDIPFRPILEHPSVAALAEHIEARCRAAGAPRRSGEGAADGRLRPLAPELRQGKLPVSYAQQRFWFLDQLGHGAAYNLASHIVLSGALDVGALHGALQAIVDRHEALRTTYEGVHGDVVQVIAPRAAVALPVLDLRALPPEERAAEVLRLHAEEARRPFDLGRDLVIRCRLLRLSDEEHRLFCTIHHIAADAWSLNLFNQELAELYSAFAAGRPSPLPPLAAQYADFAAFQRGQELGPTLAYWKQKLRAPLPVLELPLDHPPPAVQDHRGGTQRGHVAAELLQALKALARREGATLFMVLAAAFDVLLHRISGADDLILGVPSVGRSSPETERMIGLFLNTVVLRTDLSAPPDGPLTFRALVRRVRESLLDAFAHQDAPFEKLVEELQPDRLPGRAPIFEVMLNLVNVPDTKAQPSGVTMTVCEEEDSSARRALTLYMKERADGLALTLTYQLALFAPERMAILLEQFTCLLEQAASEPDRAVPDFSLVTPRTRALLPELREVLPRPSHEPITRRFLEWAARAPEHPAVEGHGRVVSYTELRRDAERLARALLASGLTRGDVVAVHGPRSHGVVASLLGALMSGGVMLPLDATLPEPRQQVMLDDARARFVLTVQGAEGAARADHLAHGGRTVLVVDAVTSRLAGAEAEDASPLPVVSGDDPAYIMFTSGTTGRPKGILGVHRGVAHFLGWQRTTFGVGPGDRSAQLTGLSFDVLLRDVFLAPTSGATLCLPAYRMELDAPRLLAWLSQERISLLHLVPSLATAWLQGAPPGFRGASLRWGFFAGEPLTDTLVQRFRRLFPRSRVANLYGPSETTMAKCFYEVPAEPPPGIQPVGRPLPETQALVLDGRNRLCGIGEPGQIVLRTPFRTLGYIDDPEGQRRFLRNPERDDREDWLYCSGDRGRYRPDGSLDILGRADDQLKIRGVRVEPAEIKAVLDQHPRVGGSAVVASDAGGEARLIAYVTPRSSGPIDVIDVKELRRYLAQRLHAAFVPSAVVPLDAIPVTSNGKVDRRALPPPPPFASEAFGVPRTELERTLVQLWQEVLGLHAVGIHDDFFDVGGHSLLAVRLMACIEQRLGQRLPLTALFESPTVESLAARLRRTDAGGWAPLVPIQPRGTRVPFFCAPGVGGNVLYLYQLARFLGPDQPFYGLQALGLDGVTPPHTSVEAMAADHIRWLRTVQPEGPYLLGGHSFGGRVVFEMAQQLVEAGCEVPCVVLFDCSPPFAIDEGLSARDEVDMLGEMASILGFMAGRTVSLKDAELRAMSPEERLRSFQRAVEAAGLLPGGSNPDHVRGWLSVFKSNYQMGLSYRERPVRPVPLVYYRAAEQPPETAALRVDLWRKVGPLELCVVPGSHLTMMAEPHIQALAARLSARLAKVTRRTSS